MEATPITLQYVLTHYGPLAMGWVAAAILWFRLDKLQDTYREDKISDLEIKIQTNHTLEKLTELIKGLSNGSA